MKILFTRLMPYPYTIGGYTTYMNDLFASLLKKDNEVYVVTSRPAKEDSAINKEYPKGIKIYYTGLRHRKFGKGFLPFELLYRLFFELFFMFSVLSFYKKIKPDIVHTMDLLSESLPFALFNISFVATIYGIYLEGFKELWTKRKNKLAIFLSFIYKLMEEFNAKKAKMLFICTTKRTQEYYNKFGKTLLVGSGITFSNYKNLPKKHFYLNLNRLTEQKGTNYLISALELLDKKGIYLELNIVGDGEKDYVNRLKERAKHLKNIKVRFLGWLTGNKKQIIYGQASIFIMPSIFEPFGITILEAMASGCAIIASDCEGPKTIVKKSFGVLVPYSDEKKRAENLANAIEKSLKWDLKKMSLSARKEAKKYDYEKIAERYINVYKQTQIK